MDFTEINNLSYNIRHPWELARFEIIYKIFESKFAELHKRKIIIFDIGCGDLFFIESLSNKLPNAIFYGVDTAFNEEILNSYKNKFDTKAIYLYNSLQDAFNEVESIDIILLLDVIEHIDDDIKFLQHLENSSKITKDTLIFITGPAFQSLFTNHDLFLKHYRRYSLKQLKKIVGMAGFSSLYHQYFFHILLLPRILKKSMEIIYKSKNEKGIGKWQGSKFKTNFIMKILYLDFIFGKFFKKLNIIIPGLTSMVVCKKRV